MIHRLVGDGVLDDSVTSFVLRLISNYRCKSLKNYLKKIPGPFRTFNGKVVPTSGYSSYIFVPRTPWIGIKKKISLFLNRPYNSPTNIELGSHRIVITRKRSRTFVFAVVIILERWETISLSGSRPSLDFAGCPGHLFFFFFLINVGPFVRKQLQYFSNKQKRKKDIRIFWGE